MSIASLQVGPALIVETNWVDVNLNELDEGGDCIRLADAIRAADPTEPLPYWLLNVSEVDMFWMCGAERHEPCDHEETLKPAFLISISEDGQSRYAGMWVSTSIEVTPLTLLALACIVAEVQADNALEVSAASLAETVRVIADQCQPSSLASLLENRHEQ